MTDTEQPKKISVTWILVVVAIIAIMWTVSTVSASNRKEAELRLIEESRPKPTLYDVTFEGVRPQSASNAYVFHSEGLEDHLEKVEVVQGGTNYSSFYWNKSTGKGEWYAKYIADPNTFFPVIGSFLVRKNAQESGTCLVTQRLDRKRFDVTLFRLDGSIKVKGVISPTR